MDFGQLLSYHQHSISSLKDNHRRNLDNDSYRRGMYDGQSFVMVDYDENGRLRRLLLESFGQEYDRSAETYYPVIWTREIERQIT